MENPPTEDFPTLKDADEHKLSSVHKLLKIIYRLHSELNSININPKIDKKDKYPRPNTYKLQDIGYTNFDEFEITIKSDYFDLKKRKFALHAGFNFYLYVMQDGYGGRHEIADWININIDYLNITPISWASSHEHVPSIRKQSKSFIF